MSIKVRDAIELQKIMACRVSQQPFHGPINTIAGADMAFSADGRRNIAVITVFSFPQLRLLEIVHGTGQVRFPYIPGLLSFREAPLIIQLAGKLKLTPDLLLVDGQGIAHPRRFGLASHIGVNLDWPTIGCAKSRLIGIYRPPADARGCCCKLYDNKEVIGAVLRTREKVKCVFVSVGHRIELKQAVKIVLESAPRYRLPEPIRRAHREVTQLKKTLL